MPIRTFFYTSLYNFRRVEEAAKHYTTRLTLLLVGGPLGRKGRRQRKYCKKERNDRPRTLSLSLSLSLSAELTTSELVSSNDVIAFKS